MKTIYDFASEHKTTLRKELPIQTINAIARRVMRREKTFTIGGQYYYTNNMGVHYERLGSPFCVHYHELPLPESFWTERDYEILNLAVANQKVAV